MGIRESFNKYFLTDGSKLSLKRRIFIIALICVPYILFSFALYADTRDLFFLRTMIIILFCLFPIVFYFIFVDKINEKYGRYSEIRFGYTYQCLLHSVSYFYISIMGIILFIAHDLDMLLLGCLLSFTFVIPFISAFIRTDTFNDSSCYIGDEIVFGYHPIYHILSIIIGLFGFYNVYNLLNINFNSAILLFAITVIFQVIFIIPNWINKIVPFEIKRKEGFIIHITIIVVIYLLISFLFMGNTMFYPIHLNLTLNGIIRKIITYGTTIAMVILIIRQGKNMNKKEK